MVFLYNVIFIEMGLEKPYFCNVNITKISLQPKSNCTEMLLQILITWTATLTAAHCSSSSKSMKMLPTVSHSLVNLGKIDVSFNFFGKDPDSMYKNHGLQFPTFDQTKSEIMVDLPCPCSDLQLSKKFLPHPSEIISKVLRNNDFFKESTSSLCCNSHEQLHEDVTFINMIPNKNIFKNNRSPLIKSFAPLLVEPMPKTAPLLKPKALDILLFPKRKDLVNFDFTKTITNQLIPKDNIRIVGDKPLHNEIKGIPEAVTSVTKNLKEPNAEKQEEDKEVISKTLLKLTH
ncbi:hypothetical protein K1T71_007390 [Dendrolimus kikuchii]|uniref:Uncharacterized protein n=1 Tax=Dendrolimus kikuchii TaxID=765133 RepID=A0ACC1D0M4_9NEOP|nr:hypothetical protein K1T71_007390 [Dendrolimus kikuchii]